MFRHRPIQRSKNINQQNQQQQQDNIQSNNDTITNQFNNDTVITSQQLQSQTQPFDIFNTLQQQNSTTQQQQSESQSHNTKPERERCYTNERNRQYNKQYNRTRNRPRNITVQTSSDDNDDRDSALDNPDDPILLHTQNPFTVTRRNQSFDTQQNNNTVTSAYDSSGLTHYGLSTFYLHPPAVDTSVWDLCV